MCYSAEVSLGTFSAVSCVSIYLWIRNNKIDRAISLMLFVIVFMQLLEYILWINQECNMVNRIITSIIPYYIYLQPVILTFIVWQMKAGWGTLYPLILAVLLIIFPYFISSSIKNKRTCVKKGEGNHLNWYIKDDFFDNSYPILDRLIILLYYISMTYAFATLNNKNIAYIFVILYNISFLITRLIYRETWASVWCHSVNAAAVFALFL